MIWRTVAGLLVLALLLANRAYAGDLKLTVAGVRSDAGALMIGLYDSAERFDTAVVNASKIGLLSDKGRLFGVAMRARIGAQGIGFLQLPPGRYAVIVFHDENDNGLLDRDFWGIPKEGYGFGNNATGFFSAPSFNAAAVTVGSADTVITVFLTYPGAATPSPRSRQSN